MAGVRTIRDRLKRETAPIHARMERDLGLAERTMSRSRYVFVLARLYGFHAAWEPTVARALCDDAFWEPRRRLRLLSDDLNAFGFSPSDISALPTCPALPTLHNEPRALGSAYVLEGSRLGGAIVARNLKATRCIDGPCGCAYFAGDGTAGLWPDFLCRLEAAATPDNAPDIVAAAVETFDRLHWWLCRNG